MQNGNARFTTVPLKSINHEFDINVIILKTDYFHLWFHYKSDLRNYTAGKHIGIIKIKHCLVWKMTIFSTSLRYRCKSNIFAWRVSYNYAYSLFNYAIIIKVCLSDLSLTVRSLPSVMVLFFIGTKWRRP